MRIYSVLASVLAVMVWTAPALVAAKDDTLAKTIAGQHRSENFVTRDRVRRPQDVLEFAGLKPTMTVVEVAPGHGYWTEILAPYLHDRGTYYVVSSANGLRENLLKKMERENDIFGRVNVTVFGAGEGIAPAGSADVVLTFRNVHNFMAQGTVEQAFKYFYDALKPGGVLLVEEHRARTDKQQDPKAENGYVREDYTIRLAEKAGFKLMARSEMLANPKDTADWPNGVWTLPPTLVLGEQDREKYLAIGEADNFLLKFEKPTDDLE